MTRPADIGRLFRDVVAAGTRHQLTLEEQVKDGGLLVRCRHASNLPDGVASPFLDSPDSPGSFLTVDPAGHKPAPPEPNENGEIPADEQLEYGRRVEAWRAHRKLYDDLFAARTPAEQFELVVAVGLIEHVDGHGLRHHRHLVAAPAEIVVDQETQRLSVVVSDAVRVEHNWLAGHLRSQLVEATDDRTNRRLLEVLADEAETYQGASETWWRARSVYGQDTRWEQDRHPQVGVVGLSVEPAVLLRKKDTSHLLALLTDMVDDLDSGGHVSGPLRMLADMTAEVEDLPVRTDRPALPKAANDEQRSMLEQARRSPHTIIQGPPGTGKTHTIANLAAVLMAEGRRVLITAENDRALREVQGKLPRDMQPLLLPLLKDGAESGLARSVTSLIEEADKQRRGVRPDVERSLTARRDKLEEDAEATVREIRRVDALEADEHELNGRRMRLAGHMIALDGYRDELALADRLVSDQRADPDDARALLELYDVVSAADERLARLRLPRGIPHPEAFAEQLQRNREQLSQLPDRCHIDFATLDTQIVEHLEQVLARLASLPAVPYSSIERTAGDYRNLARHARDARAGLNHGVTAHGADPADARDYLAAYLELPTYYTDEPSGLVELYRRAEASAAASPSVHVAASSDPVTVYAHATDLASRFVTDPTGELLARYVTDLRHRGDSSLRHLAEHAGQLAGRIGVPPILPISVSDGAPPDHELLDQARALRDHLAGGGRMTRLIGTPGPVRDAAPLIEHVTVGGSRVDTQDEAEAVAVWLEHRIAVTTARNWAAQHDLSPPTADAQLKDWLTAVSRLPEAAAELDKKLTSLLERCHLPSDAQTRPADVLVQAVVAAAAARITSELQEFAARRQQLGSADVRVDGVAVHDEPAAKVAHAHLHSLITRNNIAAQLPRPWTVGRELDDISGDDPVAVACDVATAAADLPGVARPQTLSDATIRDVLSRVHTERRREEITDAHRNFLGGIYAALSICTPPSPATKLLADAAKGEHATAYREAHQAHVAEIERAERARHLRDATERLRRAHPTLLAAFQSEDEDTRDVLGRLDHYQDLLVYRHEAYALLEQYPDLRKLHEHLADVRTAQLRLEAELASERCWARAVERLASDRELSAALASLQKAERAVPKTKTAKSYQRKLRALRQATKDAAPAIPCWVMPIDRVAELVGYPTETLDRFDVVIVDEASQAWFPSAFLYAIAEQVIVVGDDLQTSPSDTSVSHDEMVRLAHEHIPTHKLVDQIDGQFSLYDVAAAITAPSVMVDHFRCVPPIIELSNSLCYARRGQRLLPVRVTEPDALTPIKHVRVAGRRTSSGGANIPEIDAIVDKVVACVADDEYEDLTFGVVVVGPRPQGHIKLLRSKLLGVLGPTQMQKRQIEVGSPAQYQGAERNVMFLSLVETPDENGNVRTWPLELAGRNLRRVQSLNVAASRAQDQLWIFHSFGPESLKPGDARHVLLAPPARDDNATLEAQLAKCDSSFERDVVKALAADPRVANVRTQVEALGFKIDVVIESYDKRRLAVECDGDAWHTSDKDVAKDLYRQRTLETAGGWRFQRFLASEWYADPDTIVEQTIEMLGEAPKPSPHPSDKHIDTDLDERANDTDDASEGMGAPSENNWATTAPTEPETSHTAAHWTQPTSSGHKADRTESDQTPGTIGRLTVVDGTRVSDETRSDKRLMEPDPQTRRTRDDLSSTANESGSLATYTTWDTDAVDLELDDMSAPQRNELMVEIIATEGPVTGDRLYSLFARSAGRSRVGGNIRSLLNSVTYGLERRGAIVGDNPLGESGQKVKTFRLPQQPELVVRQLGPRSIHEVPPAEIAAVMRSLARESQDQEAWFRAVLDFYGLVRLTPATKKRLEKCLKLCSD